PRCTVRADFGGWAEDKGLVRWAPAASGAGAAARWENLATALPGGYPQPPGAQAEIRGRPCTGLARAWRRARPEDPGACRRLRFGVHQTRPPVRVSFQFTGRRACDRAPERQEGSSPARRGGRHRFGPRNRLLLVGVLAAAADPAFLGLFARRCAGSADF